MNDETRLIWVRHFPLAQSDIYMGQSDAEAVVPPVMEAHAMALRKDVHDALWFTSPLRRAMQTAEWIHRSLLLSCEVIQVPELMEQSFGAWEGKHYSDIPLHAEPLETLQPPQGESFVEVTRRVHGWIDSMLRQHQARTLIMICHAGVIRAALGHALGMDPASTLRFQPGPASVTQTQYFFHQGVFHGQVGSVGIPLIMPAA